MRLLNTSTLKLSEFYDDNIPEYAILSHTWGEEEVSFHDLQNKKPEQLDGSKGYMKIKDTCCIDKTSRAELSEAINSMYRWYYNARICYVYLTNVWIGQEREYISRSVQEFRESRWFTRGWTLQELLAPRVMEFLDKDWRFLGDKDSLKDHISSITGIGQHHILDIKEASAAQKMSWASRRKTTRLEDMAYSLMGIFEVNMPLLYGEGTNAFTRLQHEIVKISDDESIFAWEDDLLESGMFARSPKAFAKSGDIVQIDDLHPLYVSRAPYAVTNKGLAIENFAHEKSKPARVSDLDISLLPLNCGRRVKPGDNRIVESVMIELTNISRDGFVRFSPRLLKPPRCSFNLSCPRLVYIRPINIVYHPTRQPPSLFISTESLIKRRLLIAEIYGCQSERADLSWSTGEDEQFWKITRRYRKFPAISFKSSKFGCPALFGVILHPNNDIIDGIDLIVPPTDQTFREEMDKYSQNCQPPGRVVNRASKFLQDGSQVSVVLKRRRVDIESSTYMNKYNSWIYILEIL